MKYRNILLFFGITTPVCLLLRTFQIVFLTTERGFVREGFSGVGLLIEILIAAVLGVTVLLSFLSHRRPTQPPRVNLPLGISAVILGAVTVLDLLSMNDLTVLPGWQRGLMAACSLLAGLALIVYGASGIFRFDAPPVIMTAPVTFWIVRLVCTFTMFNTLAMTAGHLLLLITYCADLVFMLELGKLVNGLDPERNFRKLLGSGLCAVSCGLISTVPYWIAHFAGAAETTDETGSAVWLILFQTVFIALFIFSHFSEKNFLIASESVGAEYQGETAETETEPAPTDGVEKAGNQPEQEETEPIGESVSEDVSQSQKQE